MVKPFCAESFCFLNPSLSVRESCIKIKINLNFYFQLLRHHRTRKAKNQSSLHPFREAKSLKVNVAQFIFGTYLRVLFFQHPINFITFIKSVLGGAIIAVNPYLVTKNVVIDSSVVIFINVMSFGFQMLNV